MSRNNYKTRTNALGPVAHGGWEQIQEDLRRQGRRITDQRRLILEVVRATAKHPSAEWVYQRVRRRLPRISLGTVYRNLKLLVEEGLVREMDGPGLDRYDGNTGRHDHFTCQDCGQIHDMVAPVDQALIRQAAGRTGFEILDHRVEFYGRCRACQARERGQARPRKLK